MSPNRSAEPNSDSATLPETGQPFNPYKRFNGSFIPEQICRYRGLSTGAKLVYGRLYRYAGEDGAAYPSTSALADEVGLGETQVRTYIKELETKRFLRVDRENRRYWPDGSGGSNQYAFLVHEAFMGDAGDLRKAPPPLRKTEGYPCRKPKGYPCGKPHPSPLRKTAPEESQYFQESQHKRVSQIPMTDLREPKIAIREPESGAWLATPPRRQTRGPLPRGCANIPAKSGSGSQKRLPSTGKGEACVTIWARNRHPLSFRNAWMPQMELR